MKANIPPKVRISGIIFKLNRQLETQICSTDAWECVYLSNVYVHLYAVHSHQTLKTAARGKNVDVYEGYLRGILGWL